MCHTTNANRHTTLSMLSRCSCFSRFTFSIHTQLFVRLLCRRYTTFVVIFVAVVFLSPVSSIMCALCLCVFFSSFGCGFVILLSFIGAPKHACAHSFVRSLVRPLARSFAKVLFLLLFTHTVYTIPRSLSIYVCLLRCRTICTIAVCLSNKRRLRM